MPIQLNELNNTAKQALDRLLALVPEDQRDAARAEYSRAQDQMRTALIDVTGQIETEKTELEKWRTNLDGWSRGKEEEYTRREHALRTRETGNLNPNPAPPAKPADQPADSGKYLTREEVAEHFDNFGKGIVGAHAEVLSLQHRHMQLYGTTQPFNLVEVVTHPTAKTKGMTAAFEEIHREKIAAQATAAAAEAEAKVRADERQKVLNEMGSGANRMPFPITGEDDSPLAIIARRTADTTEQFGAQAATEFYRQNVANGTFKNPAA